ncbi:MAG TPA: hypothetical protein P5105_06750, partial [Victivallales bacterium]|nr:hypothetical protein [Victivallales bacterium]
QRKRFIRTFYFVVFSLILITFFRHSYADEPPFSSKEFVDSVIGENRSVEEKLKIIDVFQSTGEPLDVNNAYRLIKYIPLADKKLTSSLLEFIREASVRGCPIESAVVSKELSPLMDEYIENHEYDRFRYLLSVLEWVYQNDASVEDKNIFLYSDLLLFTYLKKYDYKLLEYYLDEHPTELPDVASFPDFSVGEEVADYYLHKLDKNLPSFTAKLLRYINENDLIYFIRENDINIFVGITDVQTDKTEMRTIGRDILSKITHQKDISNWKEWWENNNKDLNITQTALKTLVDKKVDDAEKRFTIRQLGYSFFLSKADIEIIRALESIIEDSMSTLDIRCRSFQTLIFIYVNYVDNIGTENFNEEVYKFLFDSIVRCVTDFLIKNAQVHDLLTILPGEIVNVRNVKTKIMAILNNTSMNRRSRGAAAYALGFSKTDKKNVGESILNFLKEDLPGREPDTTNNRTVLGLMSLTRNKSFSFNLEEWRKAVSEIPDDPPEENLSK